MTLNFSTLNWRLIILLIIFVELLSFLSFFWSALAPFFLLLITIIVFLVAYHRLEYGLLIVLTELIIASHGHLLNLEIFGFSFSLRMAIWSVVLLAWLLKIPQLYQLSWKNWRLVAQKIYQRLPWFQLLLYLAVFVFLGILTAWLFNNPVSLILADVNSWLFFLLFLPVSAVYYRANPEIKQRLISVFFLAVIYLSLKTLLLLFFFSYNFAFLPDLYRWLRSSYIAEVTVLTSAWPRIFLQSHIFAALAYLLLIFQTPRVAWKKDWSRWLLATLFLSTVIISLSRSFWLVLGLTIFVSLPFIWRRLAKLKLFWLWLLKIVLSLIGALLIIFIVNNLPIPDRTSDFSLRLILDRASLDSQESALASRWSLLPALFKEIKRSPIIGQGFGASVKYQSLDPRVLEQNETGWYETYAFEWGYLDLWLKLGLGGLVAYLTLLMVLIWQAFKEQNYLFALAPAIFFLAGVHFFTPYLNHPLGIGFLVFSSCLLFKDKL